ncbi:MAG: hypothetical protein Q8P26_00180 [Candidatus Levybacteria bacterium]|nr:hypothetical protein [Candidatus Levybacteria bacterium]
MKELFKNIKKDKTITLAFFINSFCITISIILILLSYGKLPPFLPIFNQLPWGEQRLGATITIFIPVLVSIIILGINAPASALIYGKIPLIARILTATSLLVGILTFLFIARTVTLVL